MTIADEELDMQDDNLEEDEDMEGADDSDVTGDSDGEAEGETESVEDVVGAAASASLAARDNVPEYKEAEIDAFLDRRRKNQDSGGKGIGGPTGKPGCRQGRRPVRGGAPVGPGLATCGPCSRAGYRGQGVIFLAGPQLSSVQGASPRFTQMVFI